MKKLIDAGILFTLVLVITVFLAALHLAQASEISSKNMDDVIASGWWVNHSEGIEVTEEGVTVTFHSDSLNYSNANYTWDAPSYVLYTADESFAGGSGISNISGYSEYFFLRSDLYGWDKSGNTTGIGLTDAVWTVVSEPDDWEAWQDSVAAGIDCTLEAWLSDSAVVITLEVGDAVSTAVVPVDDVIPYISISGELCDLTEIVVTSTAVSRDTNVGEIVIASGECGDDLIWELYDDWKIVISGTGDMYDYISSTLPWWPLCSQIRYAVFEDGVTSIGDSAFYEHTNLCSVELSDSITSIGEYAFCDCGITSIDIPENVTEIGYRAFFGSELVKVEIPDSVTTLGETAFCYCDALAEVVIGNGVTSIATGTFESCESLTKVVIPDSVKSIGSYAFAWCSGLTDVTIGSGVTSI